MLTSFTIKPEMNDAYNCCISCIHSEWYSREHKWSISVERFRSSSSSISRHCKLHVRVLFVQCVTMGSLTMSQIKLNFAQKRLFCFCRGKKGCKSWKNLGKALLFLFLSSKKKILNAEKMERRSYSDGWYNTLFSLSRK